MSNSPNQPNTRLFEEFSVRIGEDTPYAASLYCVPMETDDDLQWQGVIDFDDDALNFPVEIESYSGGESFVMYDHWIYPREVPGGAHMLSLLEAWWKSLTALFERVKAMAKS